MPFLLREQSFDSSRLISACNVGVPKIRGTILGVPITRIIVFLGSILGSPYFGKLPCQYRYGRVWPVERAKLRIRVSGGSRGRSRAAPNELWSKLLKGGYIGDSIGDYYRGY